MRKFLTAFFALLCVPLLTLCQNSRVIEVHGLVTDIGTGHPLANHPVKVFVDTANAAGVFHHAELTTSPSGTYQELVEIPAEASLEIWVETMDCQGEVHTRIVGVTPNGLSGLPANFAICGLGDPPACAADFEFWPDTTLGPRTFVFQNRSIGNISRLEWHFGDGSSSRDWSPVHTFPSDGFYFVELVIEDSTGGCTDQTVRELLVGRADSANCFNGFDFVGSPNDPMRLQFNGWANTPAVDWQWDFGDGSTAAGPHLEHSFPQRGSYLVCLTTTDERGCVATSCDSVFVPFQQGPPCFAEFEYEFLGDMTFQFWNHSAADGSTGLQYEWAFGDGTSSSEENPVHTFGGYGAYEICLTVWNSEGCQANFCNFIVIADTNTNCLAAFEYEPDTLAGPFTYRFYNASSGEFDRYKWYFPDGYTSEEPSPVYTFPGEGHFRVGLLIHNQDWTCWDSTVQDIFIDDGIPNDCYAHFGFFPDEADEFKVNFEGVGGPNIVEWKWDFGNGRTALGRNVQHRFDQPGEYWVCLRVQDESGCRAEFCEPVRVPFNDHPCHAGFSFELTADGQVKFDNHSQSSTAGSAPSFYWDFGDGSTSTDPFPAHTYQQDGVYEVCLTLVDESGCEDTWCERVYVLRDPRGDCVAAFDVFRDNTLGPLGFKFVNQSTGNYTHWEWHFGDGEVSSEPNPVHYYPGPGTYFAGILIYDSTWSCWDSAAVSIFIEGQTHCEAEFEFRHDPNDGFKVQFEGFGGPEVVEWEWDFGDGQHARGRQVGHRYVQPGEYQVCLRILTANGCRTEVCKPIRVPFEDRPCRAKFEYELTDDGQIKFENHSHGSAPGNLTFAWDFGDGTTSSAAHPVHHYPQDGVYFVCLTITDETGCEDSWCERVYVLRDPRGDCVAAFQALKKDDIGPFAYQFVDQSSGNYTEWEWHFGDGSMSRDENPIHHYPGPGEYFAGILIYDSAWNCWDSAAVTIFIEGAVECEGEFEFRPDPADELRVHFEGFGGPNIVEWKWRFGDGHAATGPVVNHRYVQPGDYRVCLEIVDESGCYKEICKHIRVPFGDRRCFAKFDFEVLVDRFVKFENYSHHNDPNAPLHFFWDFGDGTTSNLRHPDHQYAQDGTYEVCLVVKDDNGCEDRFCQRVYIVTDPAGDCEAEMEVRHREVDPFTYKFINHSTGNYTRWEWHFGDGKTSVAESPIHRYPGPGRYLAGLLIFNESWDCWDSTTVSIEIDPDVVEPPVCHNRFEVSPLDGNPFAFNFVGQADTDVVTWRWDFGDGSLANGKEVQHAFASPGEYLVCLKTVDAAGCEAEFCKPVKAPYEQRTCEARFRPERLGNGQVRFENKSSGSGPHEEMAFAWSFGDGTYSEEISPSHTYTTNGTYLVCLIMVDNSGCVDSLCKAITVTDVLPPDECEAHFYYFTRATDASGTTIKFENDSRSTADRLEFFWDFGDGNTSTEAEPSHTYADGGIYTTCLTVTSPDGCSSTYCEAVFIEATQSYYTLCGAVYTGDLPADDVTVYLITLDIETQTLIALDSVRVTNDGTSDSSYYCFEYVPSNFYITKAALNPTSAYYRDYVPTYFGDVLFWAEGNFVPLFIDRDNIDIHLQKAENPGGPGFIGGNVFQGANKNGQGADRIQVMLLDENGDVVAYTYSDADGQFLFENIPYGSYSVYAEVMNLETVPVVASIDEETPGVENVGIEVGDEQVVGFLFETSEYVSAMSMPYPNPASTTVYLDMNLKQASLIRLELRNAVGQLLWSGEKRYTTGAHKLEVPVHNLPEGVYMLSIIANHQEREMKKILKY